jgi:pimeloyl-ACP methyl ester carboxylesterase
VVKGRRLAVVETGAGAVPLVLLHGWPQTSYAWRHVVTLLRSDCHALAYDLPGIGASAPASERLDKWSIAGDLHASLDQRRVRRPVIVGHDMGALVAYAYLRRYPQEVRGVMLLDAPVPGLAGWADTVASPAFWHVGFHQAGTGLAERLVADQEAGYFRSHVDRFAAYPTAITDGDIAVYVAGYQGLDRLAAGFALYRALPLDLADNERHTEALDTPVHLAFAEFSHATVLRDVSAGLREAGARRVAASVIRDSGHWVAEERPADVAAAIDRFVSDVAGFGTVPHAIR